MEAEFLYQQGLPPQATYVFKHALIQEAAYQSLLRSTRQQHHQRIAQVLAERFPETVETQPELVAHHYTEAGLREQAIPYWQHAGHRALQRSANLEAVSHVTRGLEVLSTLPETRERAQQELALQIMLGVALGAIKSQHAPETARHLCPGLCAGAADGEPTGAVPSAVGVLVWTYGAGTVTAGAGAGVALPWWLALLAEACGQGGQLDEGLRALEEALTAVQHNEEHHYEAEVYRLKGELLLQQSAAQQGEAEASFHQALTVARRQQAKSWELRAAMSLSRLWQQQGKWTEAYELLAPIYGWFTEGFDTADLQEAKALLEALT